MRRIASSLLLASILSAWLQGPVLAQDFAWTCHGPEGGRILAMGVSPNYAIDHTVFAGGEFGGLFRTTDKVAWETLTGFPSKLTISSVVVSPGYRTDRTLFVSTTGEGIFRSADSGATFKSFSDGLDALSVAQIEISPDYVDDLTLLAATDRGVYRSTTGGKLWSSVGLAEASLSVAISERRAGQFTAFVGTVAGLQVSRDNARTWSPAPLSVGPVVSVDVSPNYANDHSVLVGTLAGAYLSEDGGDTWQAPWFADQVIYDVLFSPAYSADRTLFLASDTGIRVSSDAGSHWSDADSITDAVLVIAPVPNYATRRALYAGTSRRGVFYSADRGMTWAATNTGLHGVSISTVVMSPDYARDGTIYGGGASGVWRSVDDGESWTLTSLDQVQVSALSCAPDFAAFGTVYAATNGGFYISRDRGHSWNATRDSGSILRASDMTLGATGEIWTATTEGEVFYSADEGHSWERRSSGLAGLNLTSIKWLGELGENARLLVGSWGSGVLRSEDGGLSWRPAEINPETPHIRDLTAGTTYAGETWAFASTTSGLFRSGDYGEKWDYAGMLGVDVAELALHPDFGQRPNLYAATWADGLYRSLNGGLTWNSLNSGLDNLDLRGVAVALHEGFPVIYVATRGGVWRYGGPALVAEPYPELVQVRLPLIMRQHQPLSSAQLSRKDGLPRAAREGGSRRVGQH